MAHAQAFLVATFLLLLKLSTLFHFSSSKSIGFSLELISRDSPESPLYLGNLTDSERIQNYVELSMVRAHNSESATTCISTSRRKNLQLFVSLAHFSYVVKVNIGTPSIPVFLVMDTGSGLTWTQCKPCKHCFDQVPPVFNSRASNTYRKLPCEHPLCHHNPRSFKCINQECTYHASYGNGASTKGILSVENFEFLYNNHIPLIFGCSNDNHGFPYKDSVRIGGILGLDLSPESLVHQLGRAINYRYSYCLAPYNRARMSTTFLRFGEDIHTQGRIFQSTPIITPPGFHHYYLNLMDVSIGQRRMNFPTGTFSLKQDRSGGCLIDSGTLLTFIDQKAYKLIMLEFVSYFSGFQLQRINRHIEGLDLCYRYHQGFNAYVSMIYHFQGADLTIDPKHVYYFDHELEVFCVALLPAHITILGAVNQQDIRFIFDLDAGVVQFAREDCTTETT